MTINNEYCWMHKPGGWACPECAQTEDRQPPALQPGQFEYECFPFGIMEAGVLIRRHIAEGMASVLIGTESRYMHPSGCLARIISTRLEDDTPDGTKGRVIAVCEPVDRKI